MSSLSLICSAIHRLFIPSQLLSCECMWKLCLINCRHLLCFRILSSMTSANPQKSTVSLDLCHSLQWRKSKASPITAITCNHSGRQRNRPTTRSTEQTCSQPSNHHAGVYRSHTHTGGQMLNVHHIHHAHVHKVDFKYWPCSFIVMKSYRCHSHVHMLETIQCAFTSVHTVGSHA